MVQDWAWWDPGEHGQSWDQITGQEASSNSGTAAAGSASGRVGALASEQVRQAAQGGMGLLRGLQWRQGSEDGVEGVASGVDLVLVAYVAEPGEQHIHIFGVRLGPPRSLCTTCTTCTTCPPPPLS